MEEKYICKFCGKTCKNTNSLRNHERLCKLNPNRQFTKFSDLEWQKYKLESGGTNQYIKAKNEGLPKPKILNKTRKKLSNAIKKRTKEFNKNNGLKISKTIVEKVKSGTWHTSLAKNMHYNYNGIDLHGTWELKFAQYLDLNNIKWIRPREKFKYFYDNKERYYTPDFYLIDLDVYIEIKGFKTKKDEAKWVQFPKKLKILFKNDLIKKYKLEI